MEYKIKKLNKKQNKSFPIKVSIIIQDIDDFENFYDILQDSTTFGMDLWRACRKGIFKSK